MSSLFGGHVSIHVQQKTCYGKLLMLLNRNDINEKPSGLKIAVDKWNVN